MPLEVDKIAEDKTMEGTGIITPGTRNQEVAAKELLKEWLVTRETMTNTNNRMDLTTTTLMDRRE
jgi:hypothetical protein